MSSSVSRKAVHPLDVVLDAEFTRLLHQALPVAFAIAAQLVGMLNAGDAVDRLGVARHDRRQRGDGGLKTLARPEQTEGHKRHALARRLAAAERQRPIRCAMFDDGDARGRGAVALDQHLATGIAHDHHVAGPIKERTRYRLLLRTGVGKHGMHRHDQRRGGAVSEFEHVLAALAAEDAEFVLDPDDVDTILVHAARGVRVGGAVVALDFEARVPVDDGIILILERVEIDGDLGMKAQQLVVEVGGEGGDAALARGKVPDERDLDRRHGLRRPLLQQAGGQRHHCRVCGRVRHGLAFGHHKPFIRSAENPTSQT